MQVLFGLSAFRLSAGDIAAYGVLPLPHGGIRLSRLISDLRFGGRSSRRPVRHCARIFAGLCTAVVILDCRREGICTASFHYYKSQIARDCGAAVPPRLRFRCRVRDFVRAPAFRFTDGRRGILTGDAQFRRKCFLPGGTLAHGAPLIRRRDFPRRCALSGEGALSRRIFRSDRRGAKMRSSKLQKTTHFASLRENLFISRNFLLTNGTVCRIINSSVCRNR